MTRFSWISVEYIRNSYAYSGILIEHLPNPSSKEEKLENGHSLGSFFCSPIRPQLERRTIRVLHGTPKLCDLISFDWILVKVIVAHAPSCYHKSHLTKQRKGRLSHPARRLHHPNTRALNLTRRFPLRDDAPRAGANDKSNWRHQ